MPDLLLHIGHVKTGSTWLQEAFRLSAGRLAAAGVRYPSTERRGIDYDSRTPAGNATTLLDDPHHIGRRLAAATGGAGTTALLSSEVLFNRLSGQRSLGAVTAAARGLGFARVRLLLFLALFEQHVCASKLLPCTGCHCLAP